MNKMAAAAGALLFLVVAAPASSHHFTISIAPMRDGADGGYVVAVRTQDGETVGRIRGAE